MLARLEAGSIAACGSADRRRRTTAGDAEMERLSGSLLAAAGRRGRYQSPWPAMPQSFATLSELSGRYLLTKEGRLGFVILRLALATTTSRTLMKRPTRCAS
jgi:hypothetical protein